jgi:Rha family phage regulatory protein
MDELRVFEFNQVDVVDSREVAEMTGKPHNDLMKSIRTYCEYLGQGDFSQSDFFIPSTYVNSQNKEQPCYLLTKKGCDMVANKMTGEKGVLFTAAYVTAFEKMREKISAGAFQAPKDYPSALRALADAEEKRLALEAEAKANAPLVLFAKGVEGSSNSILVRDMAKILSQNGIEIGGNRLFEWMRQNGYLVKQKGRDRNMPTQRSMDMGLFEIKETVVSRTNGTETHRTPLITGKGQTYFFNLLRQWPGLGWQVRPV